MARRRNDRLILEINSFHGGSQILTDPDKLEPYTARKLQNVVLDEIGMAKMRPGCPAYGFIPGPSGTRVLSAHVFERQGQTTQYLIHTTEGKLQWSTDLTNWTEILQGLSTTAPFSYATFLDKVYMANGVDAVMAWDGTVSGVSFPTGAPVFKYITVWKDTLWGAFTTANPHRVFTSDPGNGDNWPALGFVDVGKGQGPGINGLSSDDNALIIFKLTEHHVLYDPVEFSNRIVDTENGSLSHFGIINADGIIYFPSHNGICRYIGTAPAEVVSVAVNPLFKNYVYDEANESKWYGYHYLDRVGWCFPRDGLTDFWQLEYYHSYPEKPVVFQTAPVRVAINQRAAGAVERLWGFGDNDEFVYDMYSSTFGDDANFTSVIETGWFDFDVPHLPKYVDRIIGMARGDFTLEILKDYDESTVAKTHTVSGPATLDEYEVFTDLYCRQIAFRISASSSGIDTTQRKVPIGAEVETLTESKFAIGSLLALAKASGEFR